MSSIKLEQGERLKKIRKELGFTQTDFAAMLKVTQPHYSSIEKGVHSIAYDILMGINQNYPNLDLHWLITGQGQMFRGQPLSIAAEPEPQYRRANNEFQQVLNFLKEKFPDFEIQPK